MSASKHISQEDAFHFNFGVPLIAIIILFIGNVEIFAIYYIENFVELVKIYLFFFLFVFTIDYVMHKYNFKKKLAKGINLYKNMVLPFLFVFLFLIANLFISTTVFETNIRCDGQFVKNVNQYYIPMKFEKFYKRDREEVKKYFRSNYVFNIKINESFFGYLFLKNREFIQLKDENK